MLRLSSTTCRFVALLLLGLPGCNSNNPPNNAAKVIDQPSENWGHFSGPLRLESVDGHEQEMKVIDDFSYVDPNNKIWLAPAGSLVNGASIPRPLFSVVGGPWSGKYRNASVIHDVHCVERSEASDDVHLMFYNAMRCGGVERRKANLMYWAVYHFGPKWEYVVETRTETRTIEILIDGRIETREESVEIEFQRPVDVASKRALTSETVQRASDLILSSDLSLAELRELTMKDD